MTNQKIKNYIAFSVLTVLLAGALMPSGLAQAQACPSQTTVSGTTVNFVGELTDTGGDSTTYVWFEYGQTSSLGQRTSEQALSSPQVYCTTVSGLSQGTTYFYRAGARNSAGTSYGEIKSFTTTSPSSPSVDLRVNNSQGPITIVSGSSATLSWTSSNADSCTASGSWSGSKATNGSESTGSLTSSRTYTLICTGLGGSASDSVTVNIEAQVSSDFTVNKTVRNFSTGTAFSESVAASPRDVLNFMISVRAGNSALSNVTVRDTLPSGIGNVSDVRVDNVLTGGNILTGINIGSLIAGQEKVITFRADVLAPEMFTFGQTTLTNSVLVSSDTFSRSDTATIVVNRTGVLGIATAIPTGFTDNILFDSFLLPLAAALLVTWLLRSRVIWLNSWLDQRKRNYQEYKSKKTLQAKTAGLRFKEMLKEKGL